MILTVPYSNHLSAVIHFLCQGGQSRLWPQEHCLWPLGEEDQGLPLLREKKDETVCQRTVTEHISDEKDERLMYNEEDRLLDGDSLLEDRRTGDGVILRSDREDMNR